MVIKMSDWNSTQYLKFKKERTQPSLDLISRLTSLDPKRVLDIGCGPGNSTFALKSRFPNADITGVDYSDDMLKKAKADHPDISFQKCNAPDGLYELDGKFDLIFSNACFQWIPRQYELFDAVFEKLKDGGTLAVQIPIVQTAPFYEMLEKVVKQGKWKKLADIRDFYNLSDTEYYDILCEKASSFDMWQTTYYHTVDGAKGVLSWYSGSGLRPYLDALADDEQAEFLTELEKNINSLYPVRANGKLILKMPRLFFTAVK